METPQTPDTPDVQPDVTPDAPTSDAGQPSDNATTGTERDPYYCPGCGRGYAYPAECRGTDEAPHQPVQTVDSGELDGDPANHTPAPASE